MMRQWLLILCIVGIVMAGGCSLPDTNASVNAQNATPENSGDGAVSISQREESPLMSDLPKLEGKATIVMTVNGSPITIEVDGSAAPITAGNFVDLVNQGVYDGVAFHRVVRDPQPFVVQGGDPQSKDPKVPMNRLGTGGFIDPATSKERYIPLEIQPKNGDEPIYSKTFDQAKVGASPALQHSRGAVAMARSAAPDSASSQFYFALADLPFLDGNYAVFGYVTDGMNVVDAIEQGDRIESAKVTDGLDNLKN
ncbi:peptidylprolyl isomerase [Lyngbya sp. CCY1209]|uniref:peptidylprolyl isomerase n=1 Tax=Lyngbya sp. CCY1209 TaxID=2886103 RepID=UPI002D76D0FC|nr:peptidylprolyl isomerase [Lyngbya sp. CCY1209]